MMRVADWWSSSLAAHSLRSNSSPFELLTGRRGATPICSTWPPNRSCCSASTWNSANLMLEDPALITAIRAIVGLPGSSDDVCAAVDENGSSGDPPGEVGCEIGAGETDILDVDQLA